MKLPKLQVNRDANRDVLVSVHFDNIPDCVFDLWMYESSPDFSLSDVASAQWNNRINFTFIDAVERTGSSLELTHKVSGYENLTLKSTLTPFKDHIDILVSVDAIGSEAEHTPLLPIPNMCFQTSNAKQFKSDPENYQEFVGRCFIFTRKGPMFLSDTRRINNTICFPSVDADPNINPPKAQLYASISKDVPPMSKMFGAGHSPDRFVKPIIGIVSRDRRHLVAVTTTNADFIWQAYIDCIHNTPNWVPADGPVAKRRLHTRIILMENNFDCLLHRCSEDISFEEYK